MIDTEVNAMPCNTIPEYLQLIDEVIEKGPFSDNWESLSRHKTPQWYRQGRFGLFIHWGVYSVPAYYNEWYPRQMYLKGSPACRHHQKVYGGVEKFPYKNFVPQFKAEQFSADEWLDLFAKSGAKYIMPVGEHHDGFKMYKSSLNRWNAAEMGPHRDILHELHEACDRCGIGFCTSSHRAEHYWFLNGANDYDCDASRGEDADFYGPIHRDGNSKKARYSCGENMQPDEKTTVESFRDAYVREYRNGLSELYLEDLKSNKDGETGTRAWYTYYQTIEARPVSAAKGYLAYEVNTHNYRGGAHGMYDTRYLNFRMPDGHLMEIEDVFQPGYEAAVDSMLFKRLLEATHSADREELEDKAYLLDMDMYASRNFRLGEDSIHFFYNVYEIAPYSCGTTELALPYGSIKEWMKTEQ